MTLANDSFETAPKAKKRKTEQPEEVDDEEEVEAEAEDEVDGKELEDDEEDAGEDEGDEDVSSAAFPVISKYTMLTSPSPRPKTLQRTVAPRLLPKQPRAKRCRRRRALMRLTMPSRHCSQPSCHGLI